MKRIISLLMAIILLTFCFGLVACGGGQKILVNGENLAEYTVVIPKDCDKITEYAKDNFISLLKDTTGITLNVVTDDTAPVEKEILIGETNREESQTDSCELEDGEYLLFLKNKKIVMKGYGIYVGGACGDFVNKHIKPIYDSEESKIKVETISNEASPVKFAFAEKAKSVIFMIGDGMGNRHVEMGERNGIGVGQFIGKSFPNICQAKTASLSVINGDIGYTDSAASATALSTGHKTINSYLGMDENDNPLLNVRELARSKGAKTAVITTDVITGATPSGYLCHHNSRYDTEILQGQIDEIIAKKEIEYIKGSIGDTLTDETKAALNTIKGDSFFIMIEEAYTDKHSHNHDHAGVIHAVKRINDAATYAVEFVLCHPDTALIITADHETGGLVRNLGLEYMFDFSAYNHTNLDVPVYAIGTGTEKFNGGTVDNTELAKFVASVYSKEAFGNAEGYGG